MSAHDRTTRRGMAPRHALLAACLLPLTGGPAAAVRARDLGEHTGRLVRVISTSAVADADPAGAGRHVDFTPELTNRNNQAKSAAVLRVVDVD